LNNLGRDSESSLKVVSGSSSIDINFFKEGSTVLSLEDNSFYTNTSGSWIFKGCFGYPINGRLTLASGSPVTNTEISGASVLYFTPYKGDLVSVYENGKWVCVRFQEASLSLASGSPNTNYDVFCNSNGSGIDLSLNKWSGSASGQSSFVVQDGVFFA